MHRTTMLSIALAVGLLSVSVAQEVRERVRAALSYPPLVAEARADFVFNAALLERVLGNEPLEKRIARLQAQVKQKPDDADAWLQLARAYEKRSDEEDESVEQTADSQKREAFERAATLYRKLLEQSPENPTLIARLADALRGAGKHDEAQQLVRKALQIDSNKAEHWEIAGRVAEDIAVEKILELVLEAAMHDTELLRGARPFLREASTAYEQCLQRAPDNPEAMHGLARVEFWEVALFAMDESSPTLEAKLQNLQQRVLEFIKRSPQGIEAAMMTLISLHVINAMIGDRFPPETAEQLRKSTERLWRAIEAQVESTYKNADAPPRILMRLARVVLQDTTEGEMTHERFREILQALHSLEPDNMQWRLGLIGLDASQAKWDDVERLARESLQRQPTPEIHHWLIVALDRQGKLDEANRAIDEFYRAFPEDAYAMLFRSLQLMRMRGDEAALAQAGELIRAATRALDVSPDDRRWGYRESVRAAHMAMTGKTDEARALIQQVRQRYPDIQFAERVAQALTDQ